MQRWSRAMGEAATALSATERLLAEAFSDCATITAKAAARVLGLDEKTLRAMAESGVIRSITAGTKTRRYTEAHLRAFLAGERFGEVKPCRSTSQRRAASGTTTSSTRVVDITVRLEQQRAAARKKSKRPSASLQPRVS